MLRIRLINQRFPRENKIRLSGQRFAGNIARKAAHYYAYDETAELVFLNAFRMGNVDEMEKILELLSMVVGILKKKSGINISQTEIFLMNQIRMMLEYHRHEPEQTELFDSLCEMYNSLAVTIENKSGDILQINQIEAELENIGVLIIKEKEGQKQAFEQSEKRRILKKTTLIRIRKPLFHKTR